MSDETLHVFQLTQKVNQIQAKLGETQRQKSQVSSLSRRTRNEERSQTSQTSQRSTAELAVYEDDQDEDDVAADRTYSIHDPGGSHASTPAVVKALKAVGAIAIGAVAVGVVGGGDCGDCGDCGDADDYKYEIELEKKKRHQHQLHQQKEEDGGAGAGAGARASVSTTRTSAMFDATHQHLSELQKHDRKRRQQLGSLSKDLDECRAQLKEWQVEKKATKARTTTLESQIRSFRVEVGDLEHRLKVSTDEKQEQLAELTRVREELAAVRNRERQQRDNTSHELREAQQALARERVVSAQLKNALNEKRDVVEEMGSEIERLQSNLDLCCGGVEEVVPGRGHGALHELHRGGVDIAAKMRQMKAELQHASHVVDEYEKERQDLLAFSKTLMGDVEAERQAHTATQQKLTNSFTVIDKLNECLNVCVEESEITCKSVLSHVEAVRSLVREITTVGDLYSLELVPVDEVQKLKTRIGVLSKENKVLHQQATKSLTERRRDLEQYGKFATKLRNEFFVVLQAATATFSKHVE